MAESGYTLKNTCKCGCWAEVKNNYLPGHDARHVSALYKALVLAWDSEPSWYEHGSLYRNALAALPTEALKDKLRRRVSQDGWKYRNAAANSLIDQWFTPRLSGLVKFDDKTYNKGDGGGGTYFSAGILAAVGWNRQRVNQKYS